jgi:hypothetical protein
MADSSLTSLLCVQLMLVQPTPSVDYLQGLIRACGLNIVLSSIVEASKADIAIAAGYNNDKILVSIPSDYFNKNTNVIEHLLDAKVPTIVNNAFDGVTVTPRFTDVKDLYDAAKVFGIVSVVAAAADSVNLADIELWKNSNQKVPTDTNAKASKLADTLRYYYGKTVQYTTIDDLQEPSKSPAVVINSFIALAKTSSVSVAKNGGFKWQELLFNGKFVSELKAGYSSDSSLTITTLNAFIGNQTSNLNSQIPLVVSNDDLTKAQPKSTSYVAIKVANLMGYTSDEIFADIGSFLSPSGTAESVLSARAIDFDSIYTGVVASKPLLQRLCVFANVVTPNATGVTVKGALLLPKDSVLDILAAINENSGTGKLFNDVSLLSATVPAGSSFTAPSADNLKKASIVLHMLKNFVDSNNSDSKTFGPFAFDINTFFNNNTTFKSLIASLFYYDATNKSIKIRGLSLSDIERGPFVNNLAALSAPHKFNDITKKDVVMVVINNDSSIYLTLTLASQNSQNINEAKTILKSFLDDSTYSKDIILTLPSGSWSYNLTPCYLLADIAAVEESYKHAKILLDFSIVDVARVRDTLGPKGSSADGVCIREQDTFDTPTAGTYKVAQIVKILSYKNYPSVNQIKLVLSAQDNFEPAMKVFNMIFEFVDNKPEVVHVYKQLMKQYGVSEFLKSDYFKVNGVKKIGAYPVNSNNAKDDWSHVFTTLAELQIIADDTETSLDDLVTHVESTQSVSLSTGIVSPSTVKKLVWLPANLKVAFGVSDSELFDSFDANGLTTTD